MFDEVITIPKENIFMNFVLDNQNYVVFSNNPELNEGDDIFFAKEDYMDEIKIIRNIEDRNELEKVENEYNRILNLLKEGEIDGEY